MDRRPFRPEITEVGQPYVDRPVLLHPKVLVNAVRDIFGSAPFLPHVLGFERQRIEWRKPANG